MIHHFNLNKQVYYKTLLSTYNVIGKMRLSNLEIDILSTMLESGLKIVNTDTREIIRKKLNKGKYIINNYLTGLKEKGILLESKDPRTLTINPTLINSISENEVIFKFQLV